jgi:6-phosphogluconolactonase (cycloisomerase 2 family)
MSYESIRTARIKRQLSQVQTALTALYTSMTEQSASGVESYKFESGEGSQQTKRRSLTEIQDQIDRLEASEAHLINALYNMGLISVQLRRKTN